MTEAPLHLLDEEDLVREFHRAGLVLENEAAVDQAEESASGREHPVVVSTRLKAVDRARVRALARYWDVSVCEALRRILIPSLDVVTSRVFGGAGNGGTG